MPSHSELTRRQFLGALSLAATVSSCRRQLPFRESDFVVPTRSSVSLLHAPDYSTDFGDLIYRGLLQFRLPVKGRRVFLKPNLVEYEPGTAINTHPLVVAGAASAFLRAGAREVVVGEGPGHRRDIEYLLVATGFYEHLKEMKLRFIDLNHDDVRHVTLRSQFTGLGSLSFPAELLASDFIVSMPKLKTHHWAGMTASMKNLFGVVPGALYGWPKNVLHIRGIDASILDLAATIRPQFAIVDAVVGMEGDGPIMGKPRSLGFVAMGADPVAVDATCARIIGLDPTKLPYLAAAGGFLGNIGEGRIDHIGENPARYRTNFDLIESLRALRLQA